MAVESSTWFESPMKQDGSASRGRVVLVLLFALGFSVTFNIPVIPGTAYSPRLSDLLLILLANHAVLVIGKGTLHSRPSILVLGVGYYLAMWSIYSFAIGDLSGFVTALRWGAALWLVGLIVASSPTPAEEARPILVGLAVGAAMAAAISTLQLVLPSIPEAIGLPPLPFWVLGELRASGIWDHPNTNAHVTMLGVAAAVGLAKPGNRWLLVSMVIFAATTMTTQTRGILFCYLPLLALYVVQHGLTRRLVYVVLGVLMSAYFIVAFAETLAGRWLGVNGADFLSANAFDRLGTLTAAIGMAALHPFGIGLADQRSTMVAEFGFDAVHNGYVHATLVFGWPFLLVAIMYLRTTVQFLSALRLTPLAAAMMPLAVSAGVSLLMEDLTVTPSLAIVVALVIACAGHLLPPVAAHSAATAYPKTATAAKL